MKGKDIQNFTQRQLQVLPHILATSTYEEAARRASISSKQIYKWLQDPLFRKELSKKRTEAYNQAIFILKTSSLKAVETLSSLLVDKDPRIRLSAADKILSHTLRGVEYLGFEERLSEVESRIDQAIKIK